MLKIEQYFDNEENGQKFYHFVKRPNKKPPFGMAFKRIEYSFLVKESKNKFIYIYSEDETCRLANENEIYVLNKEIKKLKLRSMYGNEKKIIEPNENKRISKSWDQIYHLAKGGLLY
jgi:hypothetical protein